MIDEFERRYVRARARAHGGNVARAAEASGIGRRYFQILRARQKATPSAGWPAQPPAPVGFGRRLITPFAVSVQ